MLQSLRSPRSVVALVSVVAAVASAAVTRDAAAQTASQMVGFEVQPINQISVSGNPGALVVNTAAAGNAPTSVTAAGTTWAVTTNEAGKKVTASLNAAMPTGVTLAVSLGAPGSGASTGSMTLGTAAIDVVTGLNKVNASGLTISYTLSATAAAGTHVSDSRSVTFTLLSAP